MDYPEQTSPRTLTVKEFDKEDQPREKAMKYGCEVLSTSELLAIILRTGVQGVNVIQLCRDILRQAGGSLRTLERFPLERLNEIKGLGPTKAVQIKAITELARRYDAERMTGERLNSSTMMYDAIKGDLCHLDHEEIWCIFLDRSNKVKAKEQITVGSDVASLFDVATVMRRALLNVARNIVLCHNHPSGNRTPSPQDDNITRRLAQAAELLDIRLLDHIIVAGDCYYSYHDEGRMPR